MNKLKLTLLLSNFFIIVVSIMPMAYGGQDALTDETRIMREAYFKSDLGKFVKNRANDTKIVRNFLNNLHRETMRLSGDIQKHLIENRERPEYSEIYKIKEQEFIALRFCIDAHKHFNELVLQARVNAKAALAYSAAVKQCDTLIFDEFMKENGETPNLWRYFNEQVATSIPVEPVKTKNLQNEYAGIITTKAKNILGSYKQFPFSKPLKPDDVTVANDSVSVNPSSSTGLSLPPLPKQPFTYDKAEKILIANHTKVLIGRITKIVGNPYGVIPCQPVAQNAKYTRMVLKNCADIITALGAYGELAEQANVFRLFSKAYLQSPNFAAEKNTAAKKETPQRLNLPTGNPQFMVSDLAQYRAAIKEKNATALNACSGTDIAGLKDDLSVPENKTSFKAVTKNIYVCTRKLVRQDRTTYYELFRSINRYWQKLQKTK